MPSGPRSLGPKRRAAVELMTQSLQDDAGTMAAALKVTQKVTPAAAVIREMGQGA